MGSWVLGFEQVEKNADATHRFEHVKRYARSNEGKRGVCSEHVLTMDSYPEDLLASHV